MYKRQTQISALALLVQHVPVHLAGGQIGVLVQIFVDEALIAVSYTHLTRKIEKHFDFGSERRYNRRIGGRARPTALLNEIKRRKRCV